VPGLNQTDAAQEFVIGGYTPPEGSRKYFGALLVSYYGPEGLLFAGRVGTGFSERANDLP
jgi:bifunctional non-homologous end joining protein LigD